MFHGLDLLSEWCGAIPSGGGIVLALLVAGAAGSPMHCAPMCGGFVLGQVADGLARVPATRMCEWHRAATAALVPYHLGRLTTYAGLGAAAAWGGGALGRVAWLPGILLLTGAGLFLAQALRRLPARWMPPQGMQHQGMQHQGMPHRDHERFPRDRKSGNAPALRFVERIQAPEQSALPPSAPWKWQSAGPEWRSHRGSAIASPLRTIRKFNPRKFNPKAVLPRRVAAWSARQRIVRGRHAPPTGYLLGLSLGFLPCGFLYGALAAAGATGRPLAGAVAMLAFGLGTVPALVLVGIAGRSAGHHFQRAATALAPAALLLNAALLTALAAKAFAGL